MLGIPSCVIDVIDVIGISIEINNKSDKRGMNEDFNISSFIY